MKKSILIPLFFLFMVANAFAQKSEIFEKDGIAIKGYDVVAFHTDAKATKGIENFTYRWKDTNWLFANQENLDMFKKDPEKYAPQYGGYCAYGTADGHKAPTETDTWTVRDNKLYFNYNKKVQGIWNKDQAGYIEKADKNWVDIRNKE
ncbi:MAG: YHS domain-containing (seleno)protein [Dyadobacter sp.]